MKKLLAAAASVALIGSLATAARADDANQSGTVQVAQTASSAPASPSWFAWRDHNWTGFYVGPEIGYDFGHFDWDYPAQPVRGFTSTNRSANQSTQGVLGGFTAGIDWQQPGAIWGWPTPPWLVVGLQLNADLLSTVSGKTACPNSVAFECKANLEYLATVGPRVGYATGPLLIYGTGGFAVGQTRNDYQAAPTNGVGQNNRKTAIGWSAGLGAQYAMTDVVSLRLEDNYYHVTASDSVDLFGEQVHNVNYGNVTHLAVVFQFGAPSAPPPAPVAATPAPEPAVVKPSKRMFIVFFEFDKSNLTPDGQKVVDAAASAYKSGKSDVAVAGYTDLSGTQQYNLALSHRRADMVKAALVKDGVPAAAVGESWFGKENPRVPTADGVREPQNRRVEVTM